MFGFGRRSPRKSPSQFAERPDPEKVAELRERLKELRGIPREERVAEWCRDTTQALLAQKDIFKGVKYKCSDNTVVGAHRFIFGMQSTYDLLQVATVIISLSAACCVPPPVFPCPSAHKDTSQGLLRPSHARDCKLHALGGRRNGNDVHNCRYFLASLYRHGLTNVDKNCLMGKMYPFNGSSKCFMNIREFFYTGAIQGKHLMYMTCTASDRPTFKSCFSLLG